MRRALVERMVTLPNQLGRSLTWGQGQRDGRACPLQRRERRIGLLPRSREPLATRDRREHQRPASPGPLRSRIETAGTTPDEHRRVTVAVQRRLDDLPGVVRLLGRPVPERRPEPVRHSGTRCSRFAFMRVAGTVQTPSLRSISDHSPQRAAVSTRNSKANRATGMSSVVRTFMIADSTSRCGSAFMCFTTRFCGPSTDLTRWQGLSVRYSIATAHSNTERMR